ncbi:hypothetical protein AB6A40_002668 [Gnathostoma spinigerum]|uniref:Hpc2-related domain-containing protein n=1 Tax=Gnathostoma spinigerum TaxID=75299 RepID=A0ABD6E785_9BILA
MDLSLAGSRKKHRDKEKHCIITLDIFKPTKNRCAEFDYEEIRRKHLKEDESSGEDERFHDKEAEELVRRLEEKYGKKRDKKGRKIRFGCADDYMDKTLGYDLDDPFIDDAEAYDEQVPSTMDTIRGGFYVNKGKLEFKSKFDGDDSESDISDSPTMRKSNEKKRRLISEDHESEPTTTAVPQSSPTVKQPSVLDTKRDATNSFCISNEGTREQQYQPQRLSSCGAPPTKTTSDVPVNQSNPTIFLKRRRLIGQPPVAKMTKNTPSPAVKAAMGVKRKLKPPLKKISTLGMGTTEELAVFLKEMTGGDLPLDAALEDVSKELTVSTAKSESKSATSSCTGDDMTVLDADDSQPTSSHSAPCLPVVKRGPGRPPGSTSHEAKTMPQMSEKLASMIDSFKQKTREFGAPEKKIRLPPFLVDLCLRIETQCSLERFNHQQKTRIFDMLANWVCVQRNSLYIRMKTQKEKREVSQVQQASTVTASLTNDANLNKPQQTEALIFGKTAAAATSDSSSLVLPSQTSQSSPSTALLKSPKAQSVNGAATPSTGTPTPIPKVASSDPGIPKQVSVSSSAISQTTPSLHSSQPPFSAFSITNNSNSASKTQNVSQTALHTIKEGTSLSSVQV